MRAVPAYSAPAVTVALLLRAQDVHDLHGHAVPRDGLEPPTSRREACALSWLSYHGRPVGHDAP